MQRSKGYALMFLLAAFAAGGALGFTADRMVNGARRGSHGSEDFRRRMAEELQLAPAQKAAIDSLMMERHRQIVALYRPIKPRLDSINASARLVSDSSHEQIKRLLTPDQQVKLDRMRAAARREMEKRRRHWELSPARSDSR